MKREISFLFTLYISMCFSGCSNSTNIEIIDNLDDKMIDNSENNIINTSEENSENNLLNSNDLFDFYGTLFIYDDAEHDLEKRDAMINSIISVTEVSDKLLITGHINPQVTYYGIFDTNSESFVAELYGNNLVWHSENLETAVFSIWGEMYDYLGNNFGSCNLGQNDYVKSITFIENNKEVEVEVIRNNENIEIINFDL